MVQISITIDLEPEYLVTGLLIWYPQAFGQVQAAVQEKPRNRGQLRKDVLGDRHYLRHGSVLTA